MIRLYGCTIAKHHARELVTSLTADGRPDALGAAHRLSQALTERAASTALSPPMRDAILRVLTNPPPSGLRALHTALANDQRARR